LKSPSQVGLKPELRDVGCYDVSESVALTNTQRLFELRVAFCEISMNLVERAEKVLAAGQ
jgi:hypothetical protein